MTEAPLRRRAVPAIVAVMGALVLAGCGGAGSSADGTVATAGVTAPAPTAAGRAPTTPEAPATTAPAAPADLGRLQGDLAEPVTTAPPLRLRDARGRLTDIRDAQGSPVMVTFVYTNCIDVCPLVLQNLARARQQLKADGIDLRVLAVSVDPKEDTPEAVRAFLRSRGLAGDIDYLVGDAPQLRRTWAAWGVGAGVPPDQPHLVEHSALVYGVSASGDLTTRYPVDVRSQTVVRDARILARA